jgi:hypothetical protein
MLEPLGAAPGGPAGVYSAIVSLNQDEPMRKEAWKRTVTEDLLASISSAMI